MPKVVNHDQYRRALLSQCFDLFAEKGYAALTMREIAQSLGVSTGTLYHYFSSKEILFEQFVEDMAAQDLMQASLALSSQTTLRERVVAAFEFVHRHEDYFFKQMLIFMDAYQHQYLHPGETHVLAVIHRVGEGVRQAVMDLLGIDDPQVCVWLLSLFDGLIIGRLYGAEHISFPMQAQICAEMLSAYLERPIAQDNPQEE